MNNKVCVRSINSMVRHCLVKSNLPNRIARAIRIRVVKQKAPTGISILQDFKKHIRNFEQGVTCT
jgi:hypothetical protein